MTTIRVIALGLVQRSDGRFLLEKGFDSKTGITYYRPLGGGVEFGEKAEAALKREFLEEISCDIDVLEKVAVIESLFSYEGTPGHEIVFIFRAHLLESKGYSKSHKVVERGKVVTTADWVDPSHEISKGVEIYPVGIHRFFGIE